MRHLGDSNVSLRLRRQLARQPHDSAAQSRVLIKSRAKKRRPSPGSALRLSMRILAAADIHGVLRVYEWLVAVADQQHADVLVLAGDLFAGDWEEGQRRQAQQIIRALQQTSVPCFYIMGNDDNVSLDYEDQQIRPLHARRIRWGTCNFVGYQYSPPFVGSAFVKPETEIAKDLQSVEPLLDRQTVLVTHTPAYGILDQTYAGEHAGSRALADLLSGTAVLAHIHGHIHSAFGCDGNHFNVASAGQHRAFLVDLPSLDHAVLRPDSVPLQQRS